MYSTDAATLAALGESHTAQFSAIMTDPNSGANPLPGLVQIGGSVSVDRTASVRRTCQVSVVANTASLPGSPTDPLAPFGNLVQLFRGLIVPASGITLARTVLFPLGVFRLKQTGSSESENGVLLQFSGADSSRAFSRAKFSLPYIIAAGTNYVTAITNLVQFIKPGAIVDAPSTIEVTPQLIFDIGDDPWQHVTEMADALGMECFFTVNDVFKLQSVPDPAVSVPVFTLIDGPGTSLTDVGRDMDDDPGYNGVIISAESSSNAAPFNATVWDDNPSSPTYYLGKYGQVPAGPITSPYIGSTAQATAFGTAWLIKNQGVSDQVTFSSIPNPALDASDVIQVKRSSMKIDATVVIESLTIPLDVSSKMTGTGAKRLLP